MGIIENLKKLPNVRFDSTAITGYATFRGVHYANVPMQISEKRLMQLVKGEMVIRTVQLKGVEKITDKDFEWNPKNAKKSFLFIISNFVPAGDEYHIECGILPYDGIAEFEPKEYVAWDEAGHLTIHANKLPSGEYTKYYRKLISEYVDSILWEQKPD